MDFAKAVSLAWNANQQIGHSFRFKPLCDDCGGTGMVPSISSSEYEICPTCKDVT